jgi:hypothetical protein
MNPMETKHKTKTIKKHVKSKSSSRSPSQLRRGDRMVTFLTQDELKRLLAIVKDKRDRAIIQGDPRVWLGFA